MRWQGCRYACRTSAGTEGEFPALHEKVTYGRYEFEVLEMDNRRILKVKFTVNAPAEPNSSSL